MADEDGEIHSRGRTFRSATWATLQQLATLGSTAVTAIILARTLSLAEFGLFNYATTLASLGSIVIAAGMSAVAIRTLVSDPQSQANTMTALVLIREAAAVVAYILLTTTAAVTGSGEAAAVSAVALLVLFARAMDATEIWFQSRAASGQTAPIRIAVVAVMLALRAYLAFSGAELMVLVILYVAESFLISALLIVRYLRATESPQFARPEGRTPIVLLRSTWVLALASLAEQINSRGDVVVIQAMIGSSSVGIYAAAARLSEMFYFLPVVFMTATFPRLLQIRNRHGNASQAYKGELQASYDRAFWAGVAFAAVLISAGPFVLTALFGSRYSAAGEILQVHALALPFVFMGAVLSKWLVAERLVWSVFMRFAMAAALNISLNVILIPPMGLVGSAWATVASYVFASYLACFLGRRTRSAAGQMTLAVVAPVRALARVIQRRGEK